MKKRNGRVAMERRMMRVDLMIEKWCFLWIMVGLD